MERSLALAEGYAASLAEVDEYLVLLTNLEEAVALGPPRIVSRDLSFVVSARQQRMMYSTVYVQLYNLVEATVTLCLQQICLAVTEPGTWTLFDLAPLLRREWVRFTAKTHDREIGEDARLKSTLWLFDRVVSRSVVDRMRIVTPLANWDDESIHTVMKRFGLGFSLSDPTRILVKRKRSNGLGALGYVKQLRNDLAHGARSFSECSEGVVVLDLKDLRNAVVAFLDELIAAARIYLENHSYLDPVRRPVVIALQSGSSPSTTGGF